MFRFERGKKESSKGDRWYSLIDSLHSRQTRHGSAGVSGAFDYRKMMVTQASLIR